MELLRDMNEVLSYLREGDIVTSDGKDQFVLKGEKGVRYYNGSRFSLDLKDVADLYKKNRFYLYEESVEIDETKDEAYYRYYRK